MIDIKQKSFHILCVDDTPNNLKLISKILDKHGYVVSLANDGVEALEYLKKNPHIDLILLDVMMPNMNGFEVCQRLKASKTKLAQIPIIFLTAISDIKGIERGFEVGGVDYLTKPFQPKELLVRMKTHLKLKFYQDQDIERTQEELVFMMSTLADKHCEETSNHVQRVAEYSYLIAKLLGYDEERALIIKTASAMHDLGKISTPDHILHKPGRLEPDELKIMKEHPTAGYDILKISNLPLLKVAAVIAHQHHEMWDGSGYPQGLKGNQIHILGRIVALADVLDALSSSRKYKKGWSVNDIFAFFKSKRGTHFDPRIVDLLMDNFGEFLEIRDSFYESGKSS